MKEKNDLCKLIVSAKGLAAIFVSGAVKGAVSNKPMSVSRLATLSSEHFLSAWFSSGSTQSAELSGVNEIS